jgi:hypothetical protein
MNFAADRAIGDVSWLADPHKDDPGAAEATDRIPDVDAPINDEASPVRGGAVKPTVLDGPRWSSAAVPTTSAHATASPTMGRRRHQHRRAHHPGRHRRRTGLHPTPDVLDRGCRPDLLRGCWCVL